MGTDAERFYLWVDDWFAKHSHYVAETTAALCAATGRKSDALAAWCTDYCRVSAGALHTTEAAAVLSDWSDMKPAIIAEQLERELLCSTTY